MKQGYQETLPQSTLEKSRNSRKDLLVKWGFEPLSMWWLNKVHDPTLDTLVDDAIAKERSYAAHDFNVREGALSQASPIITARIIKFWSEAGDIIMDPFCARLPRLLIANYLGRHAIGKDLCLDFYNHDVEKIKQRIKTASTFDSDNNKIIEESIDKLRTILNKLQLDIYYGDSRSLPPSDNSIDLVITSPPYWDIEYYGDDPKQLGKNTYEDFLRGMQEVMKECHRVLKPNKYAIFILNDFRKSGKFYTYHADCIKLCEEIGFNMHDIVIYNLSAHPLQAIFATELEKEKHTAKCHEYILVFRK